VLTIGNFDGVHRGHQRLIEHLREQSQRLRVPSMLMTFEPQPREFFAGAMLPARLTRFREKVQLLQGTGLDRLLCMPFNEKTAQIPASWFAEDFMSGQVGAQYVVIGDDFRFGHGREGDLSLLQRAGKKFGYEVNSMNTVLQGNERISSTLIRSTLANGDFTACQQPQKHPGGAEREGGDAGFPKQHATKQEVDHRGGAQITGVDLVAHHPLDRAAADDGEMGRLFGIGENRLVGVERHGIEARNGRHRGARAGGDDKEFSSHLMRG